MRLPRHERPAARCCSSTGTQLDGFAVTLPAIAVGGIERNPNVLSVSESSELHAAAPTPPPAENPQVLQRSVDRIDAEASSARSGDGRG